MTRGAAFDASGVYRYRLWREWEAGAPRVCFVMLNPSTADGERDDPTICRCIRFARSWGFGGVEVVNLFAYRATRPADLKRADHPVGPENDRTIADCVKRAGCVVAAWGVHGEHQSRAAVVSGLLSNAVCLGYTKNGHPRHPLYVRSESSLIAFPRRFPCAL